jgi:hypothetical protein
MAEQEAVHPGSFVGDSVEEFKKLPTWGKLLALGAVGLAAYLGYRSYQNSKGAQAAVSSASPASTAGQSPFSSVNGLPVLPSSVNPVYDPNGNLVGYQNAPTPAPTPTTPAPTPAPVPSVAPTPSNPTPGTSPGSGPLIPFGQYQGPSYSNLKPGTHYTYNGTDYLLSAGAQGRLWGQNPQGKQVLLYAPQSQYPGGKGGGPLSVVDLMHNPLIYWASAKPHKPASTP